MNKVLLNKRLFVKLLSIIILSINLSFAYVNNDYNKTHELICLDNPISLEVDSRLTTSKQKIWFYAQETYFREAYIQFLEQLGADFPDILKHITYIILRPDAVVSHALERTIQSLSDVGFRPFYLLPFTFNKFTVRELWRYNLNRAPLERFQLMDLFLPATTSIIIFLEDIKPDKNKTASLRLRLLKGSVMESKRTTNDLRTRIGAKNGLFGFIHTPDDSADILRELGILFEPQIRLNIINAIRNKDSLSVNIREIAGSFYKMYPKVSLEYDSAINELQSIISKEPSSSLRTTILEVYTKILKGEKIDWRYLLKLTEKMNTKISNWGKIIIAAYNAQDDFPNIHSIIVEGGCNHD